MKLFNRSNIIKAAIVVAMFSFFLLVATSCGSTYVPPRKAIATDTIVAATIEHMPLWKCTMVWSDSVTVETYTYAKDRYDADRTLTRDLDDQSYVSYELDTVAVMPAVKE
jgi:hypothetical protein